VSGAGSGISPTSARTAIPRPDRSPTGRRPESSAAGAAAGVGVGAGAAGFGIGSAIYKPGDSAATVAGKARRLLEALTPPSA
jgi:hypothetical protein